MKCIAWHEIESIEPTPKGRGQYMLKVKALPDATIHCGAHMGMCGMGDDFEIDLGDLSRREAEDEADELMRQVHCAKRQLQTMRA